MKEKEVIWYEVKQRLSLFNAQIVCYKHSVKNVYERNWWGDPIAKEGISFRQP